MNVPTDSHLCIYAASNSKLKFIDFNICLLSLGRSFQHVKFVKNNKWVQLIGMLFLITLFYVVPISDVEYTEWHYIVCSIWLTIYTLFSCVYWIFWCFSWCCGHSPLLVMQSVFISSMFRIWSKYSWWYSISTKILFGQLKGTIEQTLTLVHEPDTFFSLKKLYFPFENKEIFNRKYRIFQ